MTNDRIRYELLQLGNNAQEVADTLAIRGAKGLRTSGCECPIAQYLKGLGVRRPVVGQSLIQHEDGVIRNVPYPVQTFITAFDNGQFVSLQERVSYETYGG
jgi:hypothetical protein